MYYCGEGGGGGGCEGRLERLLKEIDINLELKQKSRLTIQNTYDTYINTVLPIAVLLLPTI